MTYYRKALNGFTVVIIILHDFGDSSGSISRCISGINSDDYDFTSISMIEH